MELFQSRLVRAEYTFGFHVPNDFDVVVLVVVVIGGGGGGGTRPDLVDDSNDT